MPTRLPGTVYLQASPAHPTPYRSLLSRTYFPKVPIKQRGVAPVRSPLGSVGSGRVKSTELQGAAKSCDVRDLLASFGKGSSRLTWNRDDGS